jgi:NifU-like protein involved in Fe-S cluster formation
MDLAKLQNRLRLYEIEHTSKQGGYRGTISNHNILCTGRGKLGCNPDKIEMYIRIDQNKIIEKIAYQTTNSCVIMDSLAHAWCKLSDNKILTEMNKIRIEDIVIELKLTKKGDSVIVNDEVFVVHYESILDIVNELINDFETKGMNPDGKLIVHANRKRYY